MGAAAAPEEHAGDGASRGEQGVGCDEVPCRPRDLADAVAWMARSLPAAPAGAGARPGSCWRSRAPADRSPGSTTRSPPAPRSTSTPREWPRPGSGRLLAEITRALPAKPVDVAVDGARLAHRLRLRPVHPADHAGRGLPVRCRRCPPPPARSTATLRRGGRPGGRGRRPRRHAADAHRHPGGDRGRPGHPGRHRPVPAGGPGIRLAAGDPGAVDRGAGAGPHAGRRGQDADQRPGASLSLSSGGSGEGILGLSGKDRQTTTRLLDAEFVKYRAIMPSESAASRRCRSACSPTPPSGSPWSPSAARRCAASSPPAR